MGPMNSSTTDIRISDEHKSSKCHNKNVQENTILNNKGNFLTDYKFDKVFI